MRILFRLLRALPLLLLLPLLTLLPILCCALTDVWWWIAGRRARRLADDVKARTDAISVVIPNWNGRDLLEKYLPSVIDAVQVLGHPDSEIIVVDNASTDGSVDYVERHFALPWIKVLRLPENLGFGGGSNAGFRAAENDIVLLLNSDMRVEPSLLRPLLDGFQDNGVFAVSCQIFFTDPAKRREETGLTQFWWSNGSFRVRHRDDPAIQTLFPCFYGGGGSSAFDRRKFLDLGGFDSLLAPFYLEDTDLGYLAWKRGWKVLYQPASHVWHEHRGTIGKHFSHAYIQSILEKNFLLICWKNIHEWRRLIGHFLYNAAGALISAVFGESLERASLRGLWLANRQLPGVIRSRWRALTLARIGDTEAFRRPLGGYFRDRFSLLPPKVDRPRVLFVAPYPILPPVHGGAVFMSQTTCQLAQLTDLHIIVLLDRPEQQGDHAALANRCRSTTFLARMPGRPKGVGSILPFAIREFSNPDLDWLIHRTIYLHKIDAVQLDYLHMAQYAGQYRQIGCFLFEHDLYFQTVARQLPGIAGLGRRAAATFEYLRALRYELRVLPSFDRVQVCSSANMRYLASFLPSIANRLDPDLRAGITVSNYPFQTSPREPDTILFLGSFRHAPNTEALQWFARTVLPQILSERPSVRLIVVGSDPPPQHSLPDFRDALEFRGYVANILEPLHRYAVFVCPIRSGSGVRVKLLEAFATGIPVVSTHVGAEGLAEEDGSVCRLSDDGPAFAEAVLDLLADPDRAELMACRARRYVEKDWDLSAATRRLLQTYTTVVEEKRSRVTR